MILKSVAYDLTYFIEGLGSKKQIWQAASGKTEISSDGETLEGIILEPKTNQKSCSWELVKASCIKKALKPFFISLFTDLDII